MSQPKSNKRYLNLGKHLNGKYGEFLQLGDPNAKNAKYKYTVQVRVLDSNDKVLATVTNPRVSLRDPRKRPGISEEQAAKIPEMVLSDLSITIEE